MHDHKSNEYDHQHEYNVTYHGLHCWSKAMFEKLGWMILAKRDGYSYKIETYKKGIEHLLSALDEKIKCTHDADRIEDLQIIHKNVQTLKEHVDKDFSSSKMSKKSSKKSKKSSSKKSKKSSSKKSKKSSSKKSKKASN